MILRVISFWAGRRNVRNDSNRKSTRNLNVILKIFANIRGLIVTGLKS